MSDRSCQTTVSCSSSDYYYVRNTVKKLFSCNVRVLFSKLVYLKPHPFPPQLYSSVQAALLWWPTKYTEHATETSHIANDGSGCYGTFIIELTSVGE